jgi:hypothetical protein
MSAMDTTPDLTGKTVIISQSNLETALRTLQPQLAEIITACTKDLYLGAIKQLFPKLPNEEYDALLGKIKIIPPDLDRTSNSLFLLVETLRDASQEIATLVTAKKFPAPGQSLPNPNEITPKIVTSINPSFVGKTVDLKDPALLFATTALRLYTKQVKKGQPKKVNVTEALANPTSYATTLLAGIINEPNKEKKAKEAKDREALLLTADPKDRAILTALQDISNKVSYTPKTNNPSNKKNPNQPPQQQQQRQPPPQQPAKPKGQKPKGKVNTPPQKPRTPSPNKTTSYPFTPAAQKRTDRNGFNVPFGVYRAHGIKDFNYALPSNTEPLYFHYKEVNGKFVKSPSNAKTNTAIKSPPKN